MNPTAGPLFVTIVLFVAVLFSRAVERPAGVARSREPGDRRGGVFSQVYP